MRYLVVDKNEKGYCISFDTYDAAAAWYRSQKKYILSPNSTVYKYKVINTKDVWSGFSIGFKIAFRGYWHWLPELKVKKYYMTKSLRVLFLTITLESVYFEKWDKTILTYKDLQKEVKGE